MIAAFQNLFAPPRHMILLVAAAWLGLTLAEKRTEQHGVSKDDLNNLTFFALLAFIIGGRIAYILQNLPAFTKSPLGIISINPDLFDPPGALVAGIIAALIYGQQKKILFWNALDSLATFFAVLAIGLGLSHLAAGTFFGQPTDLPWAIKLWNAQRHPTQIYETIASLLTLSLLWGSKPNPRPGVFFLYFASLASFSHLIIHAFRADGPILFNGFHLGQIIAWITLATSFVLLESRLSDQRLTSIVE